MIVLERPVEKVGVAEVLPAMDKVRVRVGAEHINGAAHNGWNCPIARAIGGGVCVTPVAVRTSTLGIIAPLPLVAREFIERFDAGQDVEPFEFDLRV